MVTPERLIAERFNANLRELLSKMVIAVTIGLIAQAQSVRDDKS